MTSDLAIRASKVEKTYVIRHEEKSLTLAEEVVRRLRHPLLRVPTESFRALNGLDLEVRQGEIVGIVGRNGAGKSTLLKVFSRITPPSAGRIELFGRVGSLLEVGTGFHAELTGRENVYLSGSILGMKTKEIDRQFDRIVEFAGVERFLDTPVKRYSSGMYVRLGFAVAAHLDTEIVLVDEVLAVGDREFHYKASNRMKELVLDGRTVLLVSHSMGLISEVASRVAILDAGAVVATGEPADMIEQYSQSNSFNAQAKRPRLGLSGDVTIEDVAARKDSASEPLEISVTVRASVDTEHARVSFTLKQLSGNPIGAASGRSMGSVRAGESATVKLTVHDVPLAPGTYTLDCSASRSTDGGQVFDDTDVVVDVASFEVSSNEGAWHAGWGALRLPPPQQERL